MWDYENMTSVKSGEIMGMEDVKDVDGTVLKSGDKVIVVEDIHCIEEQFKIQN